MADIPLTRYEQVKKQIEGKIADYVQIEYDIPDELNHLNPSNYWWRIGFRSSDSVWKIPAALLYRVQSTINLFDAYGVTYWILVMAEGQKEVVKAMCQKALSKKVAEIQGGLIHAIAEADRKWKECEAAVGLTEKERGRKLSARDSRIRATLKKTGENLNQAIECAMLFDETESCKALFDALQLAIATRSKAFNLELEARK